jgi:predicted TIM-barrel fold metal-dependent hydrolase
MGMNAGIDPALRNLPLGEFRPRSNLRIEEHRVARSRFPAIDVHNHLGRWLSQDGGWASSDVDDLIALMDPCNVTSIVNLDGRWGDELQANLDRYDRAHPGRFATFCHLDWSVTSEPEFTDRLVGSLERSAAAGAKGVKVWKDLGLRIRDHADELLMPDDDRLSDVWSAAGELGLPILIHVGDPVAFFEAVDGNNERLEELLEHPDWSFSDPRFPRFERIVESLEAIVAAHPETTFIGAHVGCFAENLSWVSRMLTAYPNFNVDIAARIAELGRQPRAARTLMIEHSDRVCFGTDEFPPNAEVYAIHYRFLETDDEHFPYSLEQIPPQGRWAISGLALPDAVLRKVYHENAARLVPGLM